MSTTSFKLSKKADTKIKMTYKGTDTIISPEVPVLPTLTSVTLSDNGTDKPLLNIAASNFTGIKLYKGTAITPFKEYSSSDNLANLDLSVLGAGTWSVKVVAFNTKGQAEKIISIEVKSSSTTPVTAVKGSTVAEWDHIDDDAAYQYDKTAGVIPHVENGIAVGVRIENPGTKGGQGSSGFQIDISELGNKFSFDIKYEDMPWYIVYFGLGLKLGNTRSIRVNGAMQPIWKWHDDLKATTNTLTTALAKGKRETLGDIKNKFMPVVVDLAAIKAIADADASVTIPPAADSFAQGKAQWLFFSDISVNGIITIKNLKAIT